MHDHHDHFCVDYIPRTHMCNRGVFLLGAVGFFGGHVLFGFFRGEFVFLFGEHLGFFREQLFRAIYVYGAGIIYNALNIMPGLLEIL